MKRPAIQAPPPLTGDSADLRRRTELRLRAELSLHGQTTKPAPNKTDLDSQRQLHELAVHQVELELQNTELQKARDELEVTVEKYTDLYDFAPVGYFSIDEAGVILEANLTGAAVLGVERSRLLNRSLLRFMAPASQPVFLTFLKRIFAGTGKQVCEAALVKADATTFWAGFQGVSALSTNSPRKWCRVAVTDITSLKLAEEILSRNEALFTALIHQSPVGMYVADDLLRLQQVNPKAQPVFRNIQPLTGRDLHEIMHLLWPAKIAAQIMEHFQRTLKTGKPYLSPEFTQRRRDSGVTESYEWQIQRIKLPAGRYGVVCFFSDITERKRVEATQRRVEVLAASNQKLEQEIVRRQSVESALKISERHQRQLLEQAYLMQEQLRHVSHQILHSQEEERKRISRELHDEIAQTLVGINVHLAALTQQVAGDPRKIDQKIARTQRLVAKSVDIVHQFARELRPTALDDLGLIPALHAFMKEFTKRTGIHIHFATVSAGKMKQLSNASRTVVYRVTQEALTNVARHARASRVEVSIQKLPRAIGVTIKDNGKSFQVQKVLHAKKNKRLGLLGMRERVEMVGGSLRIESAQGQGTTIRAEIPATNGHRV